MLNFFTRVKTMYVSTMYTSSIWPFREYSGSNYLELPLHYQSLHRFLAVLVRYSRFYFPEVMMPYPIASVMIFCLIWLLWSFCISLGILSQGIAVVKTQVGWYTGADIEINIVFSMAFILSWENNNFRWVRIDYDVE